MKICIIIPAYNEEKRLGRTLDTYVKFFSQKKKEFDFELLVVLNACKDNTLGIVKKYCKKYKEIRYLDFERGGKGFAIIKGFEDALKRDNDLIGFVDADMATSPKSFDDLIKNIGISDGIIASRWKKGARQNFKLIRKITSRGFNFISRSLFLLPYEDTQCGAKIFKRKIIEKIISKITITEWAFDVNVLYEIKKQNFRIREHPTIWTDQKKSKLKVIENSIQMFLALMRLRLIHSPFKFIIRLYDKLPKKFKISH